MDSSAIAAASMSMSSAKTLQAVNVSMLKKTMDLQQNQMAALLTTMASAPSFGHKLDTRA
ncbi:MAG: putative motility protein [Oscillospiraceae bacterium]|nr:putative motility protein [Oscillospiraceae bacterium]